MARGRTLGGALCLALAVAACGGDPEATSVPTPPLRAQVLQTRPDAVAQRVEIALENTSPDEVVVEVLTLRVPGFRSAGPVPKDYPLPPGRVVDLPTPYGRVRCSGDGTARVGHPVVTVRVHTAADPRSRSLELPARDTDGLLARIAAAECTARRLAREVEVRFGPGWRRERLADGVVVHGTLEARLLIGAPRDLTQVAGSVIYALRPSPDPAPAGPLAALTPHDPHATVAVTVSVSRCDGHARAETKQPYVFLVWLAPPGGEEVAVSPVVDKAARAAFQAVCPL